MSDFKDNSQVVGSSESVVPYRNVPSEINDPLGLLPLVPSKSYNFVNSLPSGFILKSPHRNASHRYLSNHKNIPHHKLGNLLDGSHLPHFLNPTI